MDIVLVSVDGEIEGNAYKPILITPILSLHFV
jgi:hypothetical protein